MMNVMVLVVLSSLSIILHHHHHSGHAHVWHDPPALDDFPDVQCSIAADVIVLLDPTVEPDVFEMIKRAAIEAIYALDLSQSRIGIWQMSLPSPRAAMSLQRTDQESLIETFKALKRAGGDTLEHAAGKAITGAMIELNRLDPSGENGKAILYVSGSPCGVDALDAAKEARYNGIHIRGIGMKLVDESIRRLIELTGGQKNMLNVINQPAEDTKTTDEDEMSIADWFCRYALMDTAASTP